MKTLSAAFALMAFVTLGYWIFEFVGARLYQAQEMRRFVREWQAEPGPADTAPESKSPTSAEHPYPSPGSAVAILVIPRLGFSAIVVEGAEQRELKLGPGHIPGTSLPGDGGNVGIAGHRDTFFRPLRHISRNDTINVNTNGHEYRYTVVSTEIVGPNDIRVLYPAGHETLTLVTCYPFDFVGAAPKRFIVRANCANCPAARQNPL